MKNKRFAGLFFAAQVIFGAILLLQSGCETTQPNGTLVRRSSRETSSSEVTVTNNAVAKNELPPEQAPEAAPVNNGEIPLAQGSPRPVNPAYNANLQSPTRPAEPTAAEVNEAGAILEPVAKTAPESTTASEPETYTVQKGDTLSRIAKTHGTSVAEIKSANNLTCDNIKAGQKLKISGSAAAPSECKAAPASQTYTVQHGDNLSKIAAKFGVSVASIKEVNSLSSDTIKTGQTLTLPSGACAEKEAAEPAAKSTVKISGHAYTVEKGDTIEIIASRAGCKQKELMELNGISDPKKIRVGQKLKLPVGSRQIGAKAEATHGKPEAKAGSKASNGNMLPTDNILGESNPAPATAPASSTTPAATTTPSATPAPVDIAPEPVTVQPEAAKSATASTGSSGLESLDNEPVTPTVPVSSDSGSSKEQP